MTEKQMIESTELLNMVHELEIHVAVTKCNDAFIVHEKRGLHWVHLTTQFSRESLNQYLRDLVTTESELNG